MGRLTGLLVGACLFAPALSFDVLKRGAAHEEKSDQHQLMSPNLLKGADGTTGQGVQPFVGLACAMDKHNACGESLVCREGICSHCETNKECPDKFACIEKIDLLPAHMCVPRDLVEHWTHYDMVCTILIVLTAALSASAGLGGGGVYVPLTILLVGLKTSEAVPLSQTMVFAGSIVNVVMLVGDRHPTKPERPKIAYDVVMLLNPALALGVVGGVLAHLVTPVWITLACLFLTLGFAFHKSFARGKNMYAKETEERKAAEIAAQASNGGENGDQPSQALLPSDPAKTVINVEAARQRDATVAETVKVAKQVSMIFLCWMAFLMINLMHPERCSKSHWIQLTMLLVVAGVFTVCAARTTNLHNDDLDLCGNGMKYSALAFLAGFLGGFLGIGGGMVMGPVLLELGLMPEVNQATTALFVLLSSSLGTAQFILLGKEMPYFVMWYTFWVALSTIAGQMMSDRIVRVYKRTSFIVFAVCGIVAMSAVMMIWVGASEVMDNIATGRNMGFNFANVCGGH
jgi:uncharacterized membrane protein YfcA